MTLSLMAKLFLRMEISHHNVENHHGTIYFREKSTIIDFWPVDHGETRPEVISINGRQVRQTMAKSIGFLPQNVRCYDSQW